MCGRRTGVASNYLSTHLVVATNKGQLELNPIYHIRVIMVFAFGLWGGYTDQIVRHQHQRILGDSLFCKSMSECPLWQMVCIWRHSKQRVCVCVCGIRTVKEAVTWIITEPECEFVRLSRQPNYLLLIWSQESSDTDRLMALGKPAPHLNRHGASFHSFYVELSSLNVVIRCFVLGLLLFLLLLGLLDLCTHYRTVSSA